MDRFDECCPDLPEREDLRHLLEITVHSLCTPDFDRYHDLLIARHCELLDTIKGECDQRRKFINLGFTDAEWAGLSLTEMAKAYWLAIDQRHARWNSVDFQRIRVGTDMSTLSIEGSGRIVNYSFYRPPGGVDFLNSVMSGNEQVVFVRATGYAPRGEIPLTLCFAFDDGNRKWYPWCSMVDHSESGPASNIRI